MASHAPDELIKLGKIGATFGVEGWLKIHTYTESQASILDYPQWHLLDSNDQVKQIITVVAGRPHSDKLIALIEGYNTPEDARKLTGLTIAVPKAALPELEEDEHYWSDLEGMDVYNAQQALLGKVQYLISTGANDVLVIEHNGKEYAIPYLTPSVIKKVDVEKREIHVDWDLI